MAGKGVANKTRSGGRSSPLENKRKKQSPCQKKARKCSPGQNVLKETPKKKERLQESITNKSENEIIEISSSIRESNVKPHDTVDKGSHSPVLEDSGGHYQEKSSDHNLMLCKDYPDFSPTPSPCGVPLQNTSLPTPRSSSLRRKNETESPTTRREGYGGRHLTRDLFTQNYRISDWNIEGRTSTVEVPAWMPVSFQPPRDMILNELEAAVAAYIFQSKIPESHIDEEVLVECMWGYGDRGSLKSLIPKGCMDQEVLNMLVARLTFNEKSITGYSTSWFLQTNFSQLALGWVTTPIELMEWYKKKFMGTIELLRKIFIPINDDNAHWFLLVVDMRTNQLILLDSLPSATRKDTRKLHVQRLGCFLEEMLKHSSFYEQNNIENPKISQFEIVEPEGIGEQLPGSNDCGVWVAPWMIECSSYLDNYDKVHVNQSSRMRIAIDLIMHPYNKIKDEVAQRAIRWWTGLEAARKNLVNTNN